MGSVKAVGELAIVQKIKTNVENLITQGVLNEGQSNALIAKLDAAMQKLNEGNTRATSNLLHAFINEVQAYINAGILTEAKGNALIEAANNAISGI